jgi:hypothetical protein
MILADLRAMQNAAGDEKPGPEGKAGHEAEVTQVALARPVEIGGRAGPEPTRYGDWEKSGRCIDF